MVSLSFQEDREETALAVSGLGRGTAFTYYRNQLLQLDIMLGVAIEIRDPIAVQNYQTAIAGGGEGTCLNSRCIVPASDLLAHSRPTWAHGHALDVRSVPRAPRASRRS